MKIFGKTLLVALQVAAFTTALAQAQDAQDANVCLLMYSLADNDLEKYLREDLVELIKSPAIGDESLTTWVYFDQRNLADLPYEKGEPIYEELPLLYDSEGAELPVDKFEGSRYLTYDHFMSKMIVDTVLEEEQNGDSPQTVYDFLAHALPDCVAKGSTEYFLVFTSHGTGFIGFGGDENVPNMTMPEDVEEGMPEENPDLGERRRRLAQPNQHIVDAVRLALDTIEGAPAMMDVIGFDACLMSSIGAVDEYRDVAQFVLASEAVEPGHGWAYDALDTTASALDMAVNFQENFLAKTQAEEGFADVHDTPKTLAIVNTTAFSIFHEAWEALSAELFETMLMDDDPDFFAAISRARAETLAFGAAFGEKDAADIGVFLEKFSILCDIDPTGAMWPLVANAKDTYNDMFVARGTGEGTSSTATGMHVTWPEKKTFLENPSLYLSYIFDTHINDDTPMWNAFLITYLNGTSPAEATTETPVCLSSMTSSVVPTYEGQLLLNPLFSIDPDTDAAVVYSEVPVETDLVYVEYGMNLTHQITEDRRLQEKFSSAKTNDKGPGDKAWSDSGAHRRRGRRRLSQRGRRTQEEGDYYFLYGGDVSVDYDGPSATAVWDRMYYYLDTPVGYENIYVWDYGEGLKSFPVCYFSSSNVRSSEDFVDIISVDEAVANLGCIEGEIYFSVATNETSLALFTHGEGDAPSEMPSSAGGQITPIVYLDAAIGDSLITEVVGGFNETIVDWGDSEDLSIAGVPDVWNMDVYGATYGTMDMYAYDFDVFDGEGTGEDFYRFSYSLAPPEEDTSAVSKSGGGRGLKGSA